MRKIFLLLLIAVISHGAFFYFGKYLGYEDAISFNAYNKLNAPIAIISHSEPTEGIKNDNQINIEKPKTTISEIKSSCVKSETKIEDNEHRELVRSDLSNKITKDLNSSSVQEKMSAIAFLSEYGTNESKDVIKSIALSDDDSDAKAMAITVTDWSNNIDLLTSILYRSWGNNSNIKIAIINAANSIDINFNKVEFNNALLSQLNQETNPNILIKIIEYFKENDSFLMEQSKSIIGSMQNVPPEVKLYLEQ